MIVISSSPVIVLTLKSGDVDGLAVGVTTVGEDLTGGMAVATRWTHLKRIIVPPVSIASEENKLFHKIRFIKSFSDN